MSAATAPRAGGGRSRGWWWRRAIVVAVVAAQVFAAVHAYDIPHKVFGWQMFNASSHWQAEILRVTASGERHDVREPWPGGYRWEGLVLGRGLETPFARAHASAGLDSTFDFLQKSLDWVAANTPRDGDTVRLEAIVTYWDNGRGPFTRVFTSSPRKEATATPVSGADRSETAG